MRFALLKYNYIFIVIMYKLLHELRSFTCVNLLRIGRGRMSVGENKRGLKILWATYPKEQGIEII